MREIKVEIGIKFTKYKNKLFQHFTFLTNKRNINYLLDITLDINDELEKLLLEEKLENLIFLERIDKNDEIVLVYEINNDFKKPVNYYRVLYSFLPDNKGCRFCKYKKSLNQDFFECIKINKMMTKNKQRCKFFKQKKEIKT